MDGREILIVDLGSQTTRLILRRLRAAHYRSRLATAREAALCASEGTAAGVILSGSPASVSAGAAPSVPEELLQTPVPLLGICYGLQLLAHTCGGSVGGASHRREFGKAELHLRGEDPLLTGLSTPTTVWMSHSDEVAELPEDFISLAATRSCPTAAVRHRSRPIWGVQFHPEVAHTLQGTRLLANFAGSICGLSPEWTPAEMIQESVAEIRRRAGRTGTVLVALSGGVDSAVAATLIHEAVGARLRAVFVDTGLLRKDEALEVEAAFRPLFAESLLVLDRGDLFFERLSGVTDPEQKRRRIGHTFIEVFEEAARDLPDCRFLGQGTLYPDVIESLSLESGQKVTIKSHHNVGGLPERMNLALVEPLRLMFKDEVRAVGADLGLPADLLGRHPFPGPGLAIRILGEVTRERADVLRAADAIFIEELRSASLYDRVWQAFAVLLPVQTVGVMGDSRTYEHVVALRSVDASDGMTADWSRLPLEFLGSVARRIINEVQGINRVVYDVTSKPPGTIEWE